MLIRGIRPLDATARRHGIRTIDHDPGRNLSFVAGLDLVVVRTGLADPTGVASD
jgi:hypothetical protein